MFVVTLRRCVGFYSHSAYGRAGSSRRGFTLIELLIGIVLIFIISAVFAATKFPSPKELQEKAPREALGSAIRFARKLSNCHAKEMRIQFFDYSSNIELKKLAVGATGNLNNITDPNLQTSIINFVQTVTGLTVSQFTDINDQFPSKMPFFLITDANDRLIIDDNIVYFFPMTNPNKGNKISATNDVFGPRGSSKRFLTIFPNGLCEPLQFMANQYGHNGIGSLTIDVDSFSGVK